VELRKRGEIGDVLLLLEHTPVITLGRNAKAEHVLASREQLAARGVEVFECDRGGDVTYHGPGQLVGYPIFDLRGLATPAGPRRTLGAVEFVRRLEEVLIRACADFGVAARRVAGRTGVWAEHSDAKVAAIGVHISRGVTSHGFALNVSTDLDAFQLIVPCGIADKSVTSLGRELGNAPALERVLTDIRGRVPDIVINLGDQVWGQVDPAGAYEMQAELSAVEVRGNNDARPLLPDARLNSVNVALKRWIKERVPVDALNRLASLPLSASVGDGRVLAAHGTPSSPWTAALWRASGTGVAARTEEELRDAMGDVGQAEVVVVGHSHIEGVRRLGDVLVINVGAVSWQKDGDPRARWLWLERTDEGWRHEARRVEYDWRAAARSGDRGEGRHGVVGQAPSGRRGVVVPAWRGPGSGRDARTGGPARVARGVPRHRDLGTPDVPRSPRTGGRDVLLPCRYRGSNADGRSAPGRSARPRGALRRSVASASRRAGTRPGVLVDRWPARNRPLPE